MRSLWAAGLLLRRLRTERAIVLLLVALVTATAFVFAAAPRILNNITDDALRHAVATADPTQRNVALTMSGRLPAGAGGSLQVVRTFGDGLEGRVPASIAALVAGRSIRVSTVRFSVAKQLPYDTRLTLRYQDGLSDHARLVAGRWPVDRGTALHPLPLRVPGGPEPPQDAGPATILEAALPTTAADAIGVSLGDRLPIAVDGTDPLVRAGPYSFGSFAQIAPASVEVVGLYDPIDPGSDYWAGDAGLADVTFGGPGPDPTIAYATAYVADSMYGNLWTDQLPFRYEWDLTIDPQRLDAGQVAQLQIDARRLGQIGSSDPLEASLRVVTALPRILDRYVAEQASAESVLTIAAIGPFGLAGGAMTMLALLLLRRRAGALALARGRGASGSLLVGTELWEAAILAGGAVLVGLLLAIIVVPARASPLSPLLALAVGGAAMAFLLAATWAVTRRPLGLLERSDATVLRVSPRRLVLELTIVAIAVAATLLLKDRGLAVGGPAGAAPGGSAVGPGADPLLASVPVLGGLAAGIAAARLYPLPIRALGWLAARRRDIVPVLGLRIVGRQAAVANVSLLVLMLTAAFGAFASTTAASLDAGQVAASFESVGADYRVQMSDSGPLPATIAPAGLPGVSAVAPGLVDPTAPFSTSPSQRFGLYVEAPDPVAYDEVAAGTPAAPAWPAAFLAAPLGNAIGTAASPIPAILSSTVPTGGRDLAVGDTFQLTLEGLPMTFRLVEQRTTFPGLADRASFAVVPFNWVQAAVGRTVSPSAYWVRGSSEVAAPLRAAVDAAAGSIRFDSRYDALAALRDTPLDSSIRNGFLLAVALAALYMALTIIGAMVLSAARRTRDVAYLRTLGVSAAQALGLTIVEHATPVVLAVVPGVALGIWLAMLCEPGLGLGAFAGTTAVPFVVDWPSLGTVVGAIVAVVVVAVVAGTWLARRASLVEALRVDER